MVAWYLVLLEFLGHFAFASYLILLIWFCWTLILIIIQKKFKAIQKVYFTINVVIITCLAIIFIIWYLALYNPINWYGNDLSSKDSIYLFVKSTVVTIVLQTVAVFYFKSFEIHFGLINFDDKKMIVWSKAIKVKHLKIVKKTKLGYWFKINNLTYRFFSNNSKCTEVLIKFIQDLPEPQKKEK